MVEITLSHRRTRTFAPSPELSSALSDPASAIEKLNAVEYKSVLGSEKWTRSETELVVKLATSCYPLPIDWTSISIRLPRFSKGECRERYEHACAAMASHVKGIHAKEESTPKKSTKRKSKAKTTIWIPSDYESWNELRKKAWMKVAVDPNAYYMEYAKPGVLLSEDEWSQEEISLFKMLLVERPYEGQWGLFSMWFPNRTGKQCQLLYESISAIDNGKQSRTADVYLRSNKRRKRLHRCEDNQESKTESADVSVPSLEVEPEAIHLFETFAACETEPIRKLSAPIETELDVVEISVSLAEDEIEDAPVFLQNALETEENPASLHSSDQYSEGITMSNMPVSLQAKEALVASTLIEIDALPTDSDTCRNDTACDEPLPIVCMQKPAEAMCRIDDESTKLHKMESVVEAPEMNNSSSTACSNESDRQQQNELCKGGQCEVEQCEDDPIKTMTGNGSEPAQRDIIIFESEEVAISNVTDDLSEISTPVMQDSPIDVRIPTPIPFLPANSDAQLHGAIESLKTQFLAESHNLQIGFRNSSERLKIVYRDRIAQTKDPESHLTLLAKFADEADSLVTMMRIQSDCLTNVQRCRARRYLALGLIEIPRTPIPDMQL